ncbi:alpha/beta hydrolase fold domain-containing protein [Streptomyces sp. NPDC047108]|uniref:alpha/beta hydrolase n=1 Tax=Streptomyces sp. NPDC047108 TaxID=3155025 RepID=UPI0033E205DC
MADDGLTECRTVRGPHGKLIDVHQPRSPLAGAAAVLLWHGSSPDDRQVLAPLARAVARHGVPVFVPDWRPDASDHGRAHLLGSRDFVLREADAYGADPERIVLAGWSAGAPAALALALRAEADGHPPPAAVVGIASRYDVPARTTGTCPLDDLADTTAALVPVALVHGTADTTIAPAHSRTLLSALERTGRPVTLEEVPGADHGHVVMASYDPELGRCRPATAEHALRAGETTAQVIVRTAEGRRSRGTNASPAAP